MNMRQHRKARQRIQRRRANLRTRYRFVVPMADALGIPLESLAMNYQMINYSSARQHLMFEESTSFELKEYQREMIDKLIQDRIINAPARFEISRVDYDNGDLNKLRIVQPLPVINPWK